jgi:hypothetical protein
MHPDVSAMTVQARNALEKNRRRTQGLLGGYPPSTPRDTHSGNLTSLKFGFHGGTEVLTRDIQ